MALSKIIPTEFGDSVVATYWRLGEVHDIILDGQLRVVIYGYASEADRRAGKRPLSGSVIEARGGDYKPMQTAAQLYGLVKANKAFEGASDV